MSSLYMILLQCIKRYTRSTISWFKISWLFKKIEETDHIYTIFETGYITQYHSLQIYVPKLVPPFRTADPITLLGCRTNHFPLDVKPLFRKLAPPKTKVNIWWRKHVTGSGAVDVNDVPNLWKPKTKNQIWRLTSALKASPSASITLWVLLLRHKMHVAVTIDLTQFFI